MTINSKIQPVSFAPRIAAVGHGNRELLLKEGRGMENETRKVGLGQLVKGLKGHEFGLYSEDGREP